MEGLIVQAIQYFYLTFRQLVHGRSKVSRCRGEFAHHNFNTLFIVCEGFDCGHLRQSVVLAIDLFHLPCQEFFLVESHLCFVMDTGRYEALLIQLANCFVSIFWDLTTFLSEVLRPISRD